MNPASLVATLRVDRHIQDRRSTDLREISVCSPRDAVKILPASGRTDGTLGNKNLKIKTILLTAVLLIPAYASADNWSKEQMEVLKFEEACVSAKSADQLMDCFHKDFVGWGQGSTVPTTKADRKKGIVESFANSESETMLFKPLSVIVKGNMAVISYIDSSKSTNKTTKEITYSTQRWTDVCLKDGGRWYWISDHGLDISND